VTKLAQLPSTTLFITVLVSVLLHAVALAFFLNSDRSVNFSSQPSGHVAFQISLLDTPMPVTTLRSDQQENKLTKRSISKPVKPVAVQQTVETVTTTSHTAQSLQAVVSTSSNDMMKYLETEFRTRFHYPAMARQRGWEGKVIVGLDVNKAGYIHNVNVKHSSGYSVLDNNAKRTFELIGNVLPVLSKGNTQSYQFTIPVIYMLTKG
jgi:TonB family protein